MKKLILGGAQIGMNYGVTNTFEAFTSEKLSSILHRCSELNITDIDTAYGYKDSERKLGEYFCGNNFGFKIHTKLPAYINCDVNEWVNYYLNYSLRQLTLSTIETLYIHNPIHLLSANKYLIYKSLLNAKQSGLIKNIGVSVYHPEELDSIISNLNIDIVQIPVNIFDTRFLADGYLESIKSRGIRIFARSIFLQGLLLNNHNMNSYFKKWNKLFSHYYDFIRENDYSPIDLCIYFIKKIKSIDGIIFGVTNIYELNQIVESYDKNIDIKKFDFSSNDPNLVIPSNWKL